MYSLFPPDTSCVDLCGETDMPDLFEMRTVPGNLTLEAEDLCSTYELYVEDGLALQRDTVQMEWEYEEEEGQVSTFKIGFSTTVDNTEAPDIIGYQLTHSKEHVVIRHSAFGHGAFLYFMLEVINKVGMDV